jgi:hypothetical protein
MLSGQPVLSPALVIVCVIMAITAGLIYWVAALGSPWTVPWAAIRAALQLAAIASVLAAALTSIGLSSSGWPPMSERFPSPSSGSPRDRRYSAREPASMLSKIAS